MIRESQSEKSDSVWGKITIMSGDAIRERIIQTNGEECCRGRGNSKDKDTERERPKRLNHQVSTQTSISHSEYLISYYSCKMGPATLIHVELIMFPSLYGRVL